MELNEYQKQAMMTCMPSCHNIPYMLINLQGEIGELSSKIAKLIRMGKLRLDAVHTNKYGTFNHQASWEGTEPEEKESYLEAIIGELGDVQWQLSGLCSVLGLSLNDVAQYNIDKLASRKARGVISGDGDNR